jgi:hypothetical protein
MDKKDLLKIADDMPFVNRWDGLKSNILKTRDNLPESNALNDREKNLFACLLDNLGQFAYRMLGYFSDPTIVQDKMPSHMTSTYALNLVLNQVGFDLNIIQQAIYQRLVFGDLLRKADGLAALFLQPAVELGLFQPDSNVKPSKTEPREPKPVILTYLNKAPTIRMMPYSPIALVSLPADTTEFMDIDNASENIYAALRVLALAHEVGHLTFWKGYLARPEDDATGKFASFLNRHLRREGASHYIADGVEEMLADVYGALVVGLPMFYTAQSGAISRQRERYFAANSRYMVIPELRPSIYHATLKKQLGISAESISTAEKAWNGLLAKYYGNGSALGGYHAPKTVEVEAGQYRISYLTAKAETVDAVEKILHLLGNEPTKRVNLRALAQSVHKRNGKSKDTQKAAQDDKTQAGVLKNTAQYLMQIASSDAIEKDLVSDLSEYADGRVWLQPSEQNSEDSTDYWKIWADRLMKEEKAQVQAMKDANLHQSGYSDSDLDWFTVLYAGGWVMESPGNSRGGI